MWWNVDAKTDIASVGTEISSCLTEYSIPFFSVYKTTDNILSDLSSGKTPPGVFEAQIPLLHAILLTDRGKNSEAEVLLKKEKEKHLKKPFESTVNTIADRLRIKI